MVHEYMVHDDGVNDDGYYIWLMMIMCEPRLAVMIIDEYCE